MLKIFKVENYINFKEQVSLDFSASKNLLSDFADFTDSGILRFTAITGNNGSGKTVLLSIMEKYFEMLKSKDYIERILEINTKYLNIISQGNNVHFDEEDEGGLNTEEIKDFITQGKERTGAHFRKMFFNTNKPIKLSHVFENEEMILEGFIEIYMSNDGSTSTDFSISEKLIINYKNDDDSIILIDQQVYDELKHNSKLKSIISSSHYISALSNPFKTLNARAKNQNQQDVLNLTARIADEKIEELLFNDDGMIVNAKLLMDSNEFYIHPENLSDGTKKFINLISICIKNEDKFRLVLLDEFDLFLHPKIAIWFINMIRGGCFKNVQFIVTTHNPILLDNMRTDQIQMIENGVVIKLNKLHKYSDKFDKSPRKDLKFSKTYLNGKLINLPDSNNFNELLELLDE